MNLKEQDDSRKAKVKELFERNKAKLQEAVDRYDEFKALFDNSDFKKYMSILEAKIGKYKEIRANLPKLGSVRKIEQVTKQKVPVYNQALNRVDMVDTVGVTQVPVKISEEDQLRHIEEFNWRIHEVQMLASLPKHMEVSAKRCQDELEVIKAKETTNAKGI